MASHSPSSDRAPGASSNGPPPEARQRLEESIHAAGTGAVAASWLFLALVHLGLDAPAEAEKCLARVPQPAPREGGVSWTDLETEVLRREVEMRLKRRSKRSR